MPKITPEELMALVSGEEKQSVDEELPILPSKPGTYPSNREDLSFAQEFKRRFKEFSGERVGIDGYRKPDSTLGKLTDPMAGLDFAAYAGETLVGGAGAAIDAGVAKLANYLGQDVTQSRDLASDASLMGMAAGVAGPVRNSLLGTMPKPGSAAREVAKRSGLSRADARLVTGQMADKMGDIQSGAREARKWGVSLTPGEATGSRKLLQRERLLVRMPDSADTLDNFWRARAQGEVPNAIDMLRGKISPDGAAVVGNTKLAKGADAVIDALEARKKAAASPYYKRAFQSGYKVDVSDIVENVKHSINKAPQGSKQANAYRAILKSLTDTDGNPITDPSVLHRVKIEMDAQIGALKTATGADGKSLRNVVGGRFTNWNKSIVDRLSENKDYDIGRRIFQKYQRKIDRIETGLVGAARKDVDKGTKLDSISVKMFGRTDSDPKSVLAARRLFEKEGRLDEWNSGLSAFFERALGNTKTIGNPGGALYRNIWADRKQAAVLRAAMSPKQRKAFDELGRIMEAVQRQVAEGAATATDLGKQPFASTGAKVSAGVAQAGSPFSVGSRIAARILSGSNEKQAARLAEIITDPDMLKVLSATRVYSMKPARAAVALEASLAAKYPQGDE